MLNTRACGLVLATLAMAPSAPAQTAQDAFHRAYYLEHEATDLEGALDLYKKIAGDRSVSDDLRGKARSAGLAVAEELAAADMTRLVPAETLLFIEIARPGERVAELLSQLGLLQTQTGDIGVSPLLLQGALGLRGAAAAVTSIDPGGGPPNGVLILHPGDVDVVRGLIETVLPMGGVPQQAIGGHPTWSIEGQVFITLTKRLAIASPDPSLIAGVIDRLAGGGTSLADSAAMQDALEMRGDDLLFFCVNAEPLMPMLMQGLEAEAEHDQEAAMALTFLDPESLRSFAGRIGIDDEGIAVDLALQLHEGHQNLAFNLLRMPNIGAETLRLVPNESAFFVAAALNDFAPRESSGDAEPIVTAMDFGREVFGNIADITLFGMPPQDRAAAGQGALPDVCAVIRVNDPARSRALWNFVLGLASQSAPGGGAPEGRSVTVAGQPAELFQVNGVPLYLMTQGHEMYVSPSSSALERALAARASGNSVLDDDVLARSLGHVDGRHTACLVAVPGRLARMGEPHMGDQERREVMPIAQLLDESIVSLTIEHSATRLGVSLRALNLPDVSGMVRQLIESEHRVASAAGSPVHVHGLLASADGTVVPASGLVAASDVPDSGQLRARFEELNGRGDKAASLLAARALTASLGEDATALNDLAWNLLTEDRFDGKYTDFAFETAQRAVEMSEGRSWYFLDTLAHAHYARGELEAAVAVQRKAIEIGKEDSRIGEARAALERFEEALEGTK